MASESTGNRAPDEPYVTEFEATVRSVDGTNVRLEETYFYAEGGGQPADRGTLNGIDVVDVQTRDGETVHTLATAPDFETGDDVTGSIDDEFRTYCMRAHTASHVLYGAGRELFDDHGYGGFDIDAEKGRIDFETDRDPDEVNALTLQRMVNEVVWESRDVSWREMDAAQARDRDEIVFNETGAAETTDTVRVVEIDDWDIAACGGTHVENTVEIGPVKVLEVSNPGSGLVRVEYAVGPTAVRAQLDETRAATRAARTLETSVEELPERATAVVEENATLEAEVDALRDRLLEERLESLGDDTVSKDGKEWVVGELDIDGIGPNDVSDRVRELAGDIGDVVALTGVNGSAFVVVGTTGETDASELVDDVTATFGGGGGGGPTFAQGGGLDDEPAAVVDYLRTEA
ncbi:Threonyl/alanyl tRNA synthetase SAD (plasmid) [Haloterrigena turkmenica DSM 5511]|uniref:Threonyl/alanyl tRNA synthetase SAD n=1 Tax=Haloterrigena turkmenica (strain ATCC 51198 / DSM 5511 / JCM 9101 / NCIMB 13204 / VKM B-1734 / 4k) TaxID=543526 RepID=D2S292_HALTV|nr:DHHA1 domain-containing protein [Haloterrigena turkmenica]ADB63489.1 Threonyl/alanyl tRNA synthetase SAD [Haloterrigena turkmenica DSM 5511]